MIIALDKNLAFTQPVQLMPSLFHDAEMREIAMAGWINDHCLCLSAFIAESQDPAGGPQGLLLYVHGSPDGDNEVLAQICPMSQLAQLYKRSEAEMGNWAADGQVFVGIAWEGGYLDSCTIPNVIYQVVAILKEREQ